MPKRETSLRSISSHHCAQATQHLSKKSRSGGERMATMFDLKNPRFEPQALPLQRRTRYRLTNSPVLRNDLLKIDRHWTMGQDYTLYVGNEIRNFQFGVIFQKVPLC